MLEFLIAYSLSIIYFLIVYMKLFKYSIVSIVIAAILSPMLVLASGSPLIYSAISYPSSVTLGQNFSASFSCKNNTASALNNFLAQVNSNFVPIDYARMSAPFMPIAATMTTNSGSASASITMASPSMFSIAIGTTLQPGETATFNITFSQYQTVAGDTVNFGAICMAEDGTVYSQQDARNVSILPAPVPTCTSFTYTDWGACTNGIQNRSVTSSSPSGCTGGTPALTQTCTVQPVDNGSGNNNNNSSGTTNSNQTTQAETPVSAPVVEDSSTQNTGINTTGITENAGSNDNTATIVAVGLGTLGTTTIVAAGGYSLYKKGFFKKLFKSKTVTPTTI